MSFIIHYLHWQAARVFRAHSKPRSEGVSLYSSISHSIMFGVAERRASPRERAPAPSPSLCRELHPRSRQTSFRNQVNRELHIHRSLTRITVRLTIALSRVWPSPTYRRAPGTF